MKKKQIKYSGVIQVDLPPALHAKIGDIAKQAGTSISIVLAVLLALQFPMLTQANPGTAK
jgi:hypothetical protein